MKTGRNRLARKDQSRRGHATRGERSRSRLGWAALLLIGATIAVAGAPAQAATGGASPAASSYAPVEGGLSFGQMRSAGATWYGPGFYGRRTACGQVLQPGTIGVAHRSLPCGTPVKLEYRGRLIVAAVIDRGPYTRGNAFDLTNGARQALGFEGSNQIRYAVALR